MFCIFMSLQVKNQDDNAIEHYSILKREALFESMFYHNSYRIYISLVIQLTSVNIISYCIS